MTKKNREKTSNKPNKIKEKRNKWLQIRVTAQELKRLKDICLIKNVKVSNYVREKIGL